MEAKVVKDYLNLLNELGNEINPVSESDEAILKNLQETRDALASAIDVLASQIIKIDLKIMEFEGETEFHICEEELEKILKDLES